MLDDYQLNDRDLTVLKIIELCGRPANNMNLSLFKLFMKGLIVLEGNKWLITADGAEFLHHVKETRH